MGLTTWCYKCKEQVPVGNGGYQEHIAVCRFPCECGEKFKDLNRLAQHKHWDCDGRPQPQFVLWEVA